MCVYQLSETNLESDKKDITPSELNKIIDEYTAKEFFVKWCSELLSEKDSLQRTFSQVIAMYAKDPFCLFSSYKKLRKADKLYRSRSYENDDAEAKFNFQFDKECNDNEFLGFEKEECGAPPSSKCIDGRCNRSGISFLYLSNNPKTSIEELSPKKNDYISVAEFHPIRDLKIFNLSTNNMHVYDAKKEYRWLHSLIGQIELLYQKPVNENTKEEYKICQIITEIIKGLGFDGVAYSSSKASASPKEALNYAIFDTELCEPASSKLFKIEDLKIDYYPEKY